MEVISVVCVIAMAIGAYFINEAKGYKGWYATLAVLVFTPLYFVVVLQNDKKNVDEHTKRYIQVAGWAGLLLFSVIFVLTGLQDA